MRKVDLTAAALLVVAAFAASALPGDDVPRGPSLQMAAEPVAVGGEISSAVRVAPLGRGAEAGDTSLLSLGGDASKPLVVLFWSVRCPVCKRYDAALKALAKDFEGRARLVLVFANATETPADVRTWFDAQNVPVTVTTDATRQAAWQLGASLTPTALVVDASGVVRYRGPVDDDRRARHRDTTDYLRVALESVMAGKPVENPEPRAFGSSVRARRAEQR